MSNTTLTADVIAKAALPILENELGFLSTLYRAHESEYQETVNGYQKGATISIRRPADFSVRSGSVMDVQDVVEGKVSFSVDQQKGIDFSLSSTEQTLSIGEISNRLIKPAMINLVNDVASDIMSQMYVGAYNWAGTPGQDVNSFSDFNKGVTRLNEMAVPMNDRYAVLSPTDHGEMIGSFSGLYIEKDARDAMRKGYLGPLAGVDTFMSQVVPTHTNGTADNTTPKVDGGSQTVSYDTAKNTWTQSLVTDGWDSSSTLTAGSVFTISGVYMVNPKTKAATNIPQQFVVVSAVTADETTTNDTTLTISPPIITSGPHQTVDAAPADDATITLLGSASTGYRQNMLYHKNAMALAVVPMELPAGSAQVSRQTKNGLSIRVEAVRDGVNDVNKWRMDILYGRKLIDPRLITRLSGTS